VFEPDAGALRPSRDHGDVFLVTVALIAVGVELFGLACGLALAKAAATDR
jgi:hypothetical protein